MTAVMVLELEAAPTLLPALFVLDLANSSADVLLERRSRTSAGGLPSLEYLIHILASVASGAAIAAFIYAPGGSTLSDTQIIRGAGTLVLGTLLFLVEVSLFLKAVRARGREQPSSVSLAQQS